MDANGLRQRNLLEARRAFSFEDQDENLALELSRIAHGGQAGPGSPTSCAESGHNDELTHTGVALTLRGCTDGLMLGLFVMTLGHSAGWPSRLSALLCGFLLVLWALYLCLREALEVVTYEKYYLRERQREKWELDNFPEGEVAEMIQLYTRKGMPEAAARQVVELMAASPHFFIDVMMLEELQMSPPPAVTAVEAALRIGGGCLVAGGALPLITALFGQLRPGCEFVAVVLLGVVALAYVGTLRAAITHQCKSQLALLTAGAALPPAILAHMLGQSLPTLSLLLAAAAVE